MNERPETEINRQGPTTCSKLAIRNLLSISLMEFLLHGNGSQSEVHRGNWGPKNPERVEANPEESKTAEF
jgi:hypothetical protein